MAKAGPQSIPGVSLQTAYRFTASDDIEGVVFKVRALWEARIEGTPVAVRGETRREAVELALRQVRGARLTSQEP